MMRYLIFLCCVFSLLISTVALAQEQDTVGKSLLFKSKVAEIMSLKVESEGEENLSLGGVRNTTLREAPNVATVITEEIIQYSGARDLMDLLRMVPGLDFLQDEGVVGLGMRGIFANKAKILILLDGVMMNETNEGQFAFGLRLPLSNIERIEISRGPGSTIHGGMAGQAIINITSKSTSKDNTEVVAQIGVGQTGISRLGLQANVLRNLNQKVQLSLASFVGTANKSSQQRTLFDGKNVNFADSSKIENFYLNMGLKYKQLTMRFVYDNHISQRYNLPSHLLRSQIAAIDIAHSKAINTKLLLVSRLRYNAGIPNTLVNADSTSRGQTNNLNRRLTASLTAIYEPNKLFRFVAGVEFWRENSRFENPNVNFVNGKNTVTYHNIGIFGEGVLTTKYVNLTIGARYDKHSTVEGAFVPRIALTKAFEKIHFKALWAKAFKAPTILNINLAKDGRIKPEFFNVIEFEAGYKASAAFDIKANIFQTHLSQTIVDEHITSETFVFINGASITSRGLEVESKYGFKKSFLAATYSYYTLVRVGEDHLADIEVSAENGISVGMPTHKFTLQAHGQFTNRLFIHADWVYNSSKYAFFFYGKNDTDERLTNLGSTNIINLSAGCKDFLMPSLDVQIGVYNLLDSDLLFTHPFHEPQSPIPYFSREVLVTLKYRL